jgi:CheY-like chemotaxis protein
LEQLGSTTRVNLLLTDVMLPGGMNGRELAMEIERRAPGIKVLYMSGYTEDVIAHHGRLDADAGRYKLAPSFFFRRARVGGFLQSNGFDDRLSRLSAARARKSLVFGPCPRIDRAPKCPRWVQTV